MLALAFLIAAVVLAVSPARARSADEVALDMLHNLRDHGYDGDPRVNGGLGGLWVNWRTGTQPLEVNFNGTGRPDPASVKGPRHDPLTDFRYLHNLYSWRHLHPGDHQFDGDLARYRQILVREFVHPHDPRGWMYDEWMDLARLSGDGWCRENARQLAVFYAGKFFHPDIGAAYQVNPKHPHGYYRVDEALEAGCALVEAAQDFHQPEWAEVGEKIVAFIYAHAYVASAHLPMQQMDEVVLPDGSANPNERVFREPYRNYLVNGGEVRFGGVGQMVLSLLHAYVRSGRSVYLERACDLLGPLSAGVNTLGAWDAEHGGYFDGINFPGPDFQHPGTPQLFAQKKESGRQFHMLQAYHVADRLTNGRYAATEKALLSALVDRAYRPELHGLVYEMAPDWSLLIGHAKAGPYREDWVTSEAMGCALMAIFSGEEKDPW